MKNTPRFWRAAFFLMLIAALCMGLSLPAVQGTPARAAPQMQTTVAPGDVVISEFRFLGPQGGNDEFIELYNPKNVSVTITGLRIMGSNNSGGTNRRFTFGNVTLQPGQYYLLVNSNASAGLLSLQDATYSSGITDDGGIAITLGDETTIIDAVGLSSGSAYKEGTPLSPLSGSADQSHERKTGGNAGNCNDSNNNAADFIWNQTVSNPQNSSSPPLPCLVVTRVESTDGIYSTGATINVTIRFSGIVDVTGFPTLLLETGVTDRTATYVSGSGTNTLTFSYTVQSGDTSNDLDYVSTNSLTLNGGTITGPIGDAVLTLPTPGTAGSLGATSNVVVDNGIPPSIVSFTRQNPASTPTNANNLTFRVMFSEDVTNVDNGDFLITGASPTTISVNSVNNNPFDDLYDVQLSGGLNNFNGTIGLDLAAAPTITDRGGNALPPGQPSIDETYLLDNTDPTIVINLASGQNASTSLLPVNFVITFSEPIEASTFTLSDIQQTGTAGSVTWVLGSSADGLTFPLSATSLASNGTVIPSIAAGRVQDLAGNNNVASTNSTVTFGDTSAPTVTINQTSGQPDPTTTLPVRFTIIFSEPIDTRVFTTGDITQNGTATGITWNIADSGDHKTFNLTATAITGMGTVVPSIAANRVTDLVGNSNLASTSTDNSVTFSNVLPPSSVVIGEFRTRGPNGSEDEYIELYNPTSNWIDISGWKINASNDTGTVSTTPRATIPASTILRPGQYYLIANNASGGYSGNVPANLVYGTGITDAGGIALLRADNTISDQVGMGTGSAYKEGAVLAPLTTNTNQSYERKPRGAAGNCQDTADNARDFEISNPSNPHNYSSQPNLCGTSLPFPATTTTTITADSPDPSLVNSSISVSVSVTGGTSVPTGRVTITGANTVCTITLNLSGTGTCNVTFSTTGSKTLTATYLGDNTHLASSDSEPHQVSITIVRTPTRVPTLAPPPPLIAINEFVPRPGHDWNLDGVINVGDEYIELINHGVIDVNLSGYSLDDEVNIGSAPYRLPSIVLKPGERRVFYGSETGLLLSDGGDGVRLLKPNGQLGDAYNYFVVRFPDQTYCRLPDNGGADDWNQNCFPTPGLQNSQSASSVNPPTSSDAENLCPIADTLPIDFVFAECLPFGNNIWNPEYWDRFGWFGEQALPESPGKWTVFVD